MFQRSWVRVPATYTGWTFLTFIFCKNYNVSLKKTIKNEKEDGDGPFLFKKPVFDENQCDQLILLFLDFGHLQLRKIAQEHIIFAKYVKNFKKH